VTEKRVSGIDQLRATYSREIVVELEPLLDDGRPWAVKLRQVRPIVYIAVGESLPVPGDGRGPRRLGKGELTNKYESMRFVVARAICAVREALEEEDGSWSERWTPVEVVCDRPAEASTNGAARELHIDEIDLPRTENVTRCWNAIFADAQQGEKMAGTAGVSFRPAGTGDVGSGGKAVRPPSARARLGTARHSG